MVDLVPGTSGRTSWEQRAITELSIAIGNRVSVEPVSGMAAVNRLAPAAWKLNGHAAIPHRRLWDYLVERMRRDLEARGCHWDRDWEARIFTYGHASAAEGMAEAADYVAHHVSDR